MYDFNASTSHFAAADARASLLAAALVNRAFCAAAMPLLWRCPTGWALDPKAFTSSARLAMYMASIRSVHLVHWRCTLWQALTGGDDTGTIDSADGGLGAASHAQSSRYLPRLRELRVGIWDYYEDPYSLVGRSAEHAMAPLLRYVGSDLEVLSCPLTANLLDHLEEQQTQQMLEPSAETQRATTHNKPQRVLMRLQRLCLFRGGTKNTVALSSDVERLLAWLTHCPITTPRLRSIELWFHGDVLEQRLVDRAFCLLAFHEGLERLSMSHGYKGVSPSTVRRVAALGHCLPEQANDFEGAETGHEPCPTNRSPQPSHCPFAQLKYLAIRVEASSASPLASLLPSLLGLRIEMSNVRPEHRDEEELRQFLLPLQRMTQLRELSAHLMFGGMRVTAPALRTLGHLQQLRVLELFNGHAKYLGKWDLRQMLHPLRHLRKLGIHLGLSEALQHQLLRVLGESCPQLRQLEILECVALEQELKGAPHVPTFPCLEYFGVLGLNVGDKYKLR